MARLRGSDHPNPQAVVWVCKLNQRPSGPENFIPADYHISANCTYTGPSETPTTPEQLWRSEEKLGALLSQPLTSVSPIARLHSLKLTDFSAIHYKFRTHTQRWRRRRQPTDIGTKQLLCAVNRKRVDPTPKSSYKTHRFHSSSAACLPSRANWFRNWNACFCGTYNQRRVRVSYVNCIFT